MLLPRSLGLYTILTALLPSFPPFSPSPTTQSTSTTPSPSSDAGPLPILDCTIGYPGVPPAAYAQEYYSLFSIFHRSVPPPAVHIHLRMYSSTQVLAQTRVPRTKASASSSMDEKGDEAEAGRRRRFGEWLTGVWREKDALMDGFYQTGRFVTEGRVEQVGTDGEGAVEVDVGWRGGSKGRGWVEAGDAVCWFAPVWVGVGLWWMKRWVGW